MIPPPNTLNRMALSKKGTDFRRNILATLLANRLNKLRHLAKGLICPYTAIAHRSGYIPVVSKNTRRVEPKRNRQILNNLAFCPVIDRSPCLFVEEAVVQRYRLFFCPLIPARTIEGIARKWNATHDTMNHKITAEGVGSVILAL